MQKPTNYPEEIELERLGHIYRANPVLKRCGVSFHDFQGAPDDLTAALLTPLPRQDGYAPLLPGQRRVRDFLDVVRAHHRRAPGERRKLTEGEDK